MRFKRGSYALLISKACFPRLALVLEELGSLGTPATQFAKSLQRLKAEVSRGADMSYLEPFGGFPDDFTTTLHGYRARIRINPRLQVITMIDIDDA
jgi:hypothetical protein